MSTITKLIFIMSVVIITRNTFDSLVCSRVRLRKQCSTPTEERCKSVFAVIILLSITVIDVFFVKINSYPFVIISLLCVCIIFANVITLNIKEDNKAIIEDKAKEKL